MDDSVPGDPPPYDRRFHLTNTDLKVDFPPATEKFRPCPHCQTADTAPAPMKMSKTCGVLVCAECGYHDGMVRCFCGWAEDGGDGAQQLRDMGENIDEEC